MGIGHLSTELYLIGIYNGLPKIVIFILIAIIIVLIFLFFKALLFGIWYFFSDYDRSTDEKIARWNKSVKALMICALIIGIFIGFGLAYSNNLPNNLSEGQDTPTNYTFKQISGYRDMATSVSNAMDYRSSAVRNAALSMIDSSNNGSYNVGQICDIFDYSYSHWVYVSDPPDRDYNAPASTSVQLMQGDCDDFAIMMVSLMHSIGGTAHYVYVQNAKGEAHAYAEVWLGTDYDEVNELINSISYHYGGKKINYSTETLSDGTIVYWLNLDWQEEHAGGKYFKSIGNAIIVDPNGIYKISTRYT